MHHRRLVVRCGSCLVVDRHGSRLTNDLTLCGTLVGDRESVETAAVRPV